jgi:hypothetical protein
MPKTARSRASTRAATKTRDEARDLAPRPYEQERIEIARRAGRFERRLLGAVTSIRVTRTVGR